MPTVHLLFCRAARATFSFFKIQAVSTESIGSVQRSYSPFWYGKWLLFYFSITETKSKLFFIKTKDEAVFFYTPRCPFSPLGQKGKADGQVKMPRRKGRLHA